MESPWTVIVEVRLGVSDLNPKVSLSRWISLPGQSQAVQAVVEGLEAGHL